MENKVVENLKRLFRMETEYCGTMMLDSEYSDEAHKYKTGILEVIEYPENTSLQIQGVGYVWFGKSGKAESFNLECHTPKHPLLAENVYRYISILREFEIQEEILIAVLGSWIAGTLEDLDLWDVRCKYEYFVNIDERGEFNSDVRDSSGKTVFEMKGSWIFEDGFMRDSSDLVSLKNYLVSIGILNPIDFIVKGN